VAGRCDFLSRLEERTLVPATVPRELTGVKCKDHKILGALSLDYRISNHLCKSWPKYSCEDGLRRAEKRSELKKL
jgi:hypothetical protein